MVAGGKWRGHAICYHYDQGVWIYVDTGQPVEAWKERPCGECGLCDTPEGHDGCLGELFGVMNACCGHGDVADAYIQYPGDWIIQGQEAVDAINDLKRN
ncbi:hypothetical protein [Gimesia algae]|uniref:Uncharacterized protein n=1 Tax=Gimesia algae TaxID=2527971 RepID=A0A517VMQ3_9PLAN|nr:hypothetical protein [Gimesia algae]QDT94294.1 hypothetical protein Pan161_59890 [Gimesia algae]